MPTKRTTHRTIKGKKLYAVKRDDGSYADIQTYKKASRKSQEIIDRTSRRFAKAMKRLADS